jgi:ATP-binding cassette, subfamily B, bacterial PglK
MNNFLGSFSYFLFIQNFFKTRKIYLIFVLYLIGTLMEMINIGLIIPFLNLMFNESPINIFPFNFEFFKFENNFLSLNIKYLLIILIILLFIIKSITLVIVARLQSLFFAEMRTRISTYFFNLYLSKSYLFFLEKKSSSKIIRNITMLSSSYSGFLERFLLLANDFFIFLGVIIVLFIYNPVISSTVFICLISFSFLFSNFTKKHFFNLGKNLLSLSSDIIKDIQESLDNILQIKLLKKTSYFQKRFNYKVRDNSYKVAKLTFLQSLPKIFIEMISILLLFSIIFFLIYFDKPQQEILSLLTLFAIAIMRIIPVSNKLISFLNSFSSFVPSLELLSNEIKLSINTQNENESSQSEIKNLPLVNLIEVENLSFRYDEREKIIFKNINFNLKKNNIYGLAGETGSGKTTLLNIISGLIKPEKGSIKYDGFDVNKVNKNISYVSQNTYLLNTSIKMNICFGCEPDEINENKLNNCIKLSKLDKMIKNLPKGLETNISELGSNFSGGQIQRLSIARALYSNTNFIIFDEPTSSLDENTSNEILKMISSLRENKIILIISHTKKDLEICDVIFKIEDNNLLKIDDI